MSNVITYIVKHKLIKQRPMTTYLTDCFRKNYQFTGIEIGTYKGHNAKQICEALNIKTLYCIDPWDRYEGYKQMVHCNDLSIAEKEARQRLKGCPVKFIKKKSEDAVDNVPFVDFVYIDGNHEYEFVKRDIELYKDKCKIIGGHDIDRAGVKQAVDESFDKYNRIRCDWWIAHGVWFYEKKRLIDF